MSMVVNALSGLNMEYFPKPEEVRLLGRTEQAPAAADVSEGYQADLGR